MSDQLNKMLGKLKKQQQEYIEKKKLRSAIQWPVIESLNVEPVKLKEAVKRIESLPGYVREDDINSLEEEYPELQDLFGSY
tara:strand:- start:3189 stop:3431 length:243 start_codon:yes stop_codon:yes gene_type:complete